MKEESRTCHFLQPAWTNSPFIVLLSVLLFLLFCRLLSGVWTEGGFLGFWFLLSLKASSQSDVRLLCHSI